MRKPHKRMIGTIILIGIIILSNLVWGLCILEKRII